MKDNLKRIQSTMDYMERNLKTELNLQELSEMAGYSYFHYCQLFQRATGMSVMHYLVCRKLKHAIYEMSKGAKKLDIALEYGFDTYAGFYKAFYREYGLSPSKYLKSYQPSRPYRMDLMQDLQSWMPVSAGKTICITRCRNGHFRRYRRRWRFHMLW